MILDTAVHVTYHLSCTSFYHYCLVYGLHVYIFCSHPTWVMVIPRLMYSSLVYICIYVAIIHVASRTACWSATGECDITKSCTGNSGGVCVFVWFYFLVNIVNVTYVYILYSVHLIELGKMVHTVPMAR